MEQRTMLEAVEEVVELRSYRRANLYLAAGYRLLSIMTVHYGEDGKSLRRGAQYVVGRTADVPHFDSPTQAPAPPAE